MPEGHPLRPGDPARLGAYRVVTRLGEGTQGVVFLGRDDSGTNVAIKLLHARMASHPDARRRFLRELSAAKKVARFCTAQVLDADLAGDQPYIVSEYVEGRSLRSEILAEGPRAGGALERLAISTLTALAAIHKAGIVHRDFNPQNVLLGADGPRVIDFGIARALGVAGSLGGSKDTDSVGTPAYMAPEQVAGGEIGPPTDMFAWGATILFAATGRPPFGNESVPAVMERIVRTEPDVTALPEPLRSVVTACLSKDPARRPTAQQAQAALLGQEPVGAMTPPPAFGTPAFGTPGGAADTGEAGDTTPPPERSAPGTPSDARFPLPSAIAGTAGPGMPPAAPGGSSAGPGMSPAGPDRPTAAPPDVAERLRRLPVRWMAVAGAATALVAVGLAVALWPDGGSASTSPKTAAAVMPSSSASSAPNSPPDDALISRKTRRPSPTSKKKPSPKPSTAGCRAYTRAYGVPKVGTVLLKATVCRSGYSGTVVLTDTAPKDGWEVCTQLRGHVTGPGGLFISTPIMSSKDGRTHAFNNGPSVRFGAKSHRVEDWVMLNAGRCRRSGGHLTSSWQAQERLAAG